MLKPILKWAGGKRQILHHLHTQLPQLDWSICTYYEPFVGGAAMLLSLKPQAAVINDINEDLINVYRVIQHDPEALITALNGHINTEAHYYEVRSWDREEDTYASLSSIERAARTIYLNRTCFNGLYRVNSRGKFNVPYGKYKQANIVQEHKVRAFSRYLNRNTIQIHHGDYAAAVSRAKAGDFVYFDPPYDTLSPTASFTSYAKGGFAREEQRRLAELYKQLDQKGVYVMLSNHATEFITDLYRNYHIHHVHAKRLINSKGTARGGVNEVVVVNYDNNSRSSAYSF
ncbi:DNA adenine methylase [Paenibacillus assamensis]|uniref:DNA adenine methylase n=1 Tax=Paenibacillus assamensis TaxID=311244 RepID=UPI0004906D11|nr:DNA adenine methylase [Paenibacillus assamensis]